MTFSGTVTGWSSLRRPGIPTSEAAKKEKRKRKKRRRAGRKENVLVCVRVSATQM